MTDPTDPLKDGLTPPDYDEYGDAPASMNRIRGKARWGSFATRSQPYFPRRREGNSLDNPVLAAYKGAH